MLAKEIKPGRRVWVWPDRGYRMWTATPATPVEVEQLGAWASFSYPTAAACAEAMEARAADLLAAAKRLREEAQHDPS